MTSSQTPFDVAAYYEDFYRGAGPFEGVTFGAVPWDIAAPQPFVVAAEAAGRLGGRVLDTGCGLGDNAIHLARRGHRVTAVDVSPTAIAKATERAATAEVEVDFRVADAARDTAAGPFDSVLDSGMFENLEPAQRVPYLSALRRAVVPGGHLNLLSVRAGELPSELPGILPFTPEELTGMLTEAGWELLERTEQDFVCNAFATSFFAAAGVQVATAAAGGALLRSWGTTAVGR